MFLLDHLRLLVFEGPEARHFLQGQLSCDTNKLAVGKWVWGGYLTPRGRLLATFVSLGLAEDKIGLLMDKDLIPTTLAKLRMYLLRAKAKPRESESVWAASMDDADAPDAGCIAIGADTVSIGFGAGMALHCGKQASSDNLARDSWFVHCAKHGYPWLFSPLQEQLTVHHLSLDLVGGVDFDKGCYIGQEIVIRAHHRGAIKKRLYVANGDGDIPAAGSELTSPRHGGQVVGNVLYAAAQDDGFVAAVSIRKDASDAIQLNETILSLRSPPYGLIDNKFESA